MSEPYFESPEEAASELGAPLLVAASAANALPRAGRRLSEYAVDNILGAHLFHRLRLASPLIPPVIWVTGPHGTLEHIAWAAGIAEHAAAAGRAAYLALLDGVQPLQGFATGTGLILPPAIASRMAGFGIQRCAGWVSDLQGVRLVFPVSGEPGGDATGDPFRWILIVARALPEGIETTARYRAASDGVVLAAAIRDHRREELLEASRALHGPGAPRLGIITMGPTVAGALPIIERWERVLITPEDAAPIEAPADEARADEARADEERGPAPPAPAAGPEWLKAEPAATPKEPRAWEPPAIPERATPPGPPTPSGPAAPAGPETPAEAVPPSKPARSVPPAPPPTSAPPSAPVKPSMPAAGSRPPESPAPPPRAPSPPKRAERPPSPPSPSRRPSTGKAQATPPIVVTALGEGVRPREEPVPLVASWLPREGRRRNGKRIAAWIIGSLVVVAGGILVYGGIHGRGTPGGTTIAPPSSPIESERPEGPSAPPNQEGMVAPGTDTSAARQGAAAIPPLELPSAKGEVRSDSMAGILPVIPPGRIDSIRTRRGEASRGRSDQLGTAELPGSADLTGPADRIGETERTGAPERTGATVTGSMREGSIAPPGAEPTVPPAPGIASPLGGAIAPVDSAARASLVKPPRADTTAGPASGSVPVMPSWPDTFFIHVSSYQQPGQAAAEVQRLRGLGVNAMSTMVVLPARGMWYRVVVGAFPDSMTAWREASRLREIGYIAFAQVVRGPGRQGTR